MIKIEKIQQALKSISNIAKILSERGWAEANAGNISFNVTDVLGDVSDAIGEEFETSIVITSSGSRMREISEAPERYCGVITFLSGQKGYSISKFGKDEFIPTSEYLSHVMIHRYLVNENRSEKAVIHSHPDEIIAAMHIAELNTEEKINSIFNKMHSEFRMLLPDKIGYIPFIAPGTKELAEKTLQKLQSHKIVLWKDHGCISIGDTLGSALDNIEVVNKISKIYLMQK